MIESLFQSRQSPQVAHAGLRSDSRFGRTDPNRVSEQQLRDGYRGHVYAFLNLRANAIANGIDQLLVQRQMGREQFENVDLDHPWQDLLDRPSSNYNAWHIYRYIALARDAYQGAFFEIGRDPRGTPVELFPIFPDFGTVRPIGATDGGIEGFHFQPKGGSSPRMISAEDMIWLRHESPVSPLESEPLIRAADHQSDIDLFMHVYRRTSVKEGNRPDVYLSSENRLTKNQQRRYSEEFAEKYMKAGSQDNIPVFGAGMEMKRVGIPPEELEYVEGAELNVKEMLDIFGIPRAMVISESSNRSTSIAARRDFFQNTVIPNITAIARQLTHELRQAFNADRALQVSVPESIAPMDPELERKIKNEKVTHGFNTLNEMREEEGEEPYQADFADEPLVPSNVIPISQLGTLAQRQDQPQQRRIGGDGAPPVRSNGDDELTQRWRVIDAEKRGLVGAATAPIRQVFQEQLRQVTQNLDEIRGQRQEASFGLSAIFSADSLAEGLRNALEQISSFVVPAGARQAAEDMDVGETASFANAVAGDPEVREVLQQLERQSVRETRESVRRTLAETLQEGMREGESVGEIERRVRNVFEDLTENRSRLIARTNVTAGFESGQLGAFRRGGAQRKRWLSQRDGRVRQEHRIADGQEVRLDDFFEVGGEQLRFPGDPRGSADLTINCRCTMVPVIPPEA